MKLAHVILTHAHPKQLSRLIKKLSHEDAHFYIHIDKKSSIDPFLFLAEQPNIFFIKDRVRVSWGSYSIVQATLNSFEQVLSSGTQYDYINLLSGQDYPIKSTESIHSFLADNPGKIFMHFLSVMDEWHEAIHRFKKYHLDNFNFPGKYRLQWVINLILPERKVPGNITLVGRSQWFTATPSSIAYVIQHLKNDPKLVRYFKLTWAPDESIFQTILYNSPFLKDMVNNNLVYVDWSEGRPSPKLLTMEDEKVLTDSDKLFARKFNEKEKPEILDYLDKITF